MAAYKKETMLPKAKNKKYKKQKQKQNQQQRYVIKKKKMFLCVLRFNFSIK